MYDRLRLPEAGQQKFVRAEATHRIRHSILVRNGVKFGEVTVVLSHEQACPLLLFFFFLLGVTPSIQALGQCRRFLQEHLPNAQMRKTSSTAAAAQALLTEPGNCAAICSDVCATLYPGLDVLFKDIQDKDAAGELVRLLSVPI
jgi:prephenate dehydratase